MKLNLRQIPKGFSLIKILIGISVLVVLAVLVIIVMNPAQLLAKRRDDARLNSVNNIGQALQTYYAGNTKYVDPTAACTSSGTTWINCLSAANGGTGQLTGVPIPVENSLNSFCKGVNLGGTGGAQNGWCYKSLNGGAGPMLVYSRLESSFNVAKCANPETDFAWAVYSSADNKAGIVCTNVAQAEDGSIGLLQPGKQIFH